MQVLKASLKVNNPVYELEAVFALLLIVGQKRNIDLASVFQHELSLFYLFTGVGKEM